MSGTVLLLRTTDAQGRGYGGFVWPREIGAVVTAPDWSPEPTCGRGLHGLLWGEGDIGLLADDDDALWWVVEADAASVVDLGGKVKVPRCVVRYIGTRDEAVAWLVAQAPGHATCYARVTAGDLGRATAGDHGAATAGDLGTATAGDHGTATAGYRGRATAGDLGTATAGDYGAATAGDLGTATAGDHGTATAGYRGRATAGDLGTATAGDHGTATAGDHGTATAGYRGRATAGDHGTATAGDRGRATAGDLGLIAIRRWAGGRYRLVVGYVGEDGIEADVPYRLDEGGRFVRAKVTR